MANVNLRRAVGSAPLGVAERLRTLRKHAGLTQGELAGERFSKEYVSQIELGKTKPSAEAIDYLAKQLDVDPLFLETGVSSDERGRIEATLARGEALIENKRYADAVEEYVNVSFLVADQAVPELEFRALTGEAWAQMRIGEVRLDMGPGEMKRICAYSVKPGASVGVAVGNAVEGIGVGEAREIGPGDRPATVGRDAP